jgi:uncharacterized protein (DUF2252 family)
VKRLAASVVLAARNLRIDEGQAAAVVRAAIGAYRRRMRELAGMGPLDVWYDRVDVATVLALAREERAPDLKRQLRMAKVRQRTSLRVLPKLTTVVNGTRKIIDDPPLIGHLDPETFDGAAMIAAYIPSLPPDRRPLLERYTVLDTARKVVGVGSAGTRCYLSRLSPMPTGARHSSSSSRRPSTRCSRRTPAVPSSSTRGSASWSASG